MANNELEALQRAVELGGGQTAFARKLSEVTGEKVTQSHVWNWLNRDLKLPEQFAVAADEITGVPYDELCPNFRWPKCQGAA